ncbi:MAG: excinuclease ABC subunit UvrA [Peptococcaceae bacterium]|jgi:excinuclease ABC subunit A|nr:excinuclease ABC subunit UvrA [Peptococcaceae bacterium]
MAKDKIIIKGARSHNLKNIDAEIPRDKLVVITGLSGSGKSTLAFDTIYAEGQRRYVESLSSYARQFLGQMDKPDVDYIEGLSPAISIDQKTTSHNPRSTVGTVTEIYDYLRLLYARIGQVRCWKCGKPVERQTVDQMVDQILSWGEGCRLQILAPLIRGKKGEHVKILEDVRREGYVRLRVDGQPREAAESIALEKNKKHTIEVVVDRIVLRPDSGKRLAGSLEAAMALSGGLAAVVCQPPKGGGQAAMPSAGTGADAGAGAETGAGEAAETDAREAAEPGDASVAAAAASPGSAADPAPAEFERMFSQEFACVDCGISFEEPAPRIFSFNNPFGACPTCSGLGIKLEVDPDLVIPDKSKSLGDNAIDPWIKGISGWFMSILAAACQHFDISMLTPFRDLSEAQQKIVLYGAGPENITFQYTNAMGQRRSYQAKYEGIVNMLQRRYRESQSDYSRGETEQYMTSMPCPDCGGRRLRPESLSVYVGEKNIDELTRLSVGQALDFFALLRLTERQQLIARQILKEIIARLGFLNNVGLDYVTLHRAAGTLSGGEAQRIRLATQIGSSLMGVLYILDEPSIGLHQRDNARLIETLRSLRDIGNTVLVVEHDEDTIRAADYILDIGPGAGVHGGQVVCAGALEQIISAPASITGQYLSGKKRIPVPVARRQPNGKWLTVEGARENNLKNIRVDIPLGVFTCVTGVSGSGKSSLINEIIYNRLAAELNRAKTRAGEHDRLLGLEYLDKVINIDQSPIGRTPRSNPATYTGVFDLIRQVFAAVPEAKLRGYQPGRFSFNIKGGRCEACAGDGILKIEMHFLPDIYVPCEVCKGKRYNRETLEVRYKGKSIADVLDMTVDEAVEFFANQPRIYVKMRTLRDVGLGYIRLGQPATTLSGGEAQRVKLATELSRRSTGKTLYILDEPTTGLHTDDIAKLLEVLHRLVEQGDTVVVIEHNLDVIKTADYCVDLGPEGGDRGGRVIAQGTPEELAAAPGSYTGQFLRPVLAVKP